MRSSSDSPHNPTTSRPPLHPAHSASLNTLLSSPQQRSAPKPAAERVPKLCPHCGAAVTDAAKDVLLCPECRTRFLNMAVNKLMLGTTAVPLHKRPGFRAAAAQALQGPGTHSAGCDQDAISSAQGAGGTATASGDESSLQQAAASDRGHQNASVWPQVTAAEIFEIVATQQGMPLGQLTGEAGWYTQLQVQLEERVWGQGPAVRFADQLLFSYVNSFTSSQAHRWAAALMQHARRCAHVVCDILLDDMMVCNRTAVETTASALKALMQCQCLWVASVIQDCCRQDLQDSLMYACDCGSGTCVFAERWWRLWRGNSCPLALITQLANGHTCAAMRHCTQGAVQRQHCCCMASPAAARQHCAAALQTYCFLRPVQCAG